MNKADRLLGSIVIRVLNSTNVEHTLNRSAKKINTALKRKEGNYANIIFDDEAEETKSLLYDVVKDIIGKDSIAHNNSIEKCVTFYNDKCAPKILIDAKGRIKSKAFHTRESNLLFSDILIYFWITFLRNSELNMKYIYQCQYNDCETFYLAKKIDKRNKYCPDCSKICKLSDQKKQESYNKRIRVAAIKRADEAKIKLRKTIKHMMDAGNNIKSIKDYLMDSEEELSKLAKRANMSVDDVLNMIREFANQ